MKIREDAMSDRIEELEDEINELKQSKDNYMDMCEELSSTNHKLLEENEALKAKVEDQAQR